MSVISITKLYDLLMGKLGKEAAENLTIFIENKINKGLESQMYIFATKEDLSKAVSSLESKIGDSKNEMLNWMFLFWVSQLAATIGFILIYLKK